MQDTLALGKLQNMETRVWCANTSVVEEALIGMLYSRKENYE